MIGFLMFKFVFLCSVLKSQQPIKAFKGCSFFIVHRMAHAVPLPVPIMLNSRNFDCEQIGKWRELNTPRLAKGFGSQSIRGFIVDKCVSLEVQLHLTIQEQGDVRTVASDVRVACG